MNRQRENTDWAADNERAMLRGLAIWIGFMAVLFVVALVLAWVFA